MSVSQTSNAPSTSAEYDDMSWNEGDLGTQGDTSLQDAQESSSDSFGDQPQNVSKDQVLQLFNKVKASERPDQKELLGTLQEALKDLQDYNLGNDAEASALYQKVAETVGEVDASGQSSMTDSGSSGDSSGVAGSGTENADTNNPETKIPDETLGPLMTQLKADGISGSDDEIKQKIQKALSDAGLVGTDLKELPTPPDETVFGFLKAIDPKLEAALSSSGSLTPDPANAQTRQQASDSLVSCLKALGYPDVKNYTDGSFPLQPFYTNSQTAGFLKMGDQIFDINFSDPSGKLALKTWTFDTTKPLPLVNPDTGAQLTKSDTTQKWWGWWDTTTGKWQVLVTTDSDALNEFNSHDGDDVDDPGNNPFPLGGTNRFNPTTPAAWGSENKNGTAEWKAGS